MGVDGRFEPDSIHRTDFTIWVRKIGASKELSRKEREAEERENGIGGEDNDDDDMNI